MKEYKNCKYFESLCDLKDNNPFSDFSSKNLIVIGTIGDTSVPIDTNVPLEEIYNAENPAKAIEDVSKDIIDIFVSNLGKGEEV